MSYLPDQMHIERLRVALWRGTEYGGAAVMVGSGFSRNAKAVHGGAPAFPSWSELAFKLVSLLYPHPSPGKDRALAMAQAPSGALRLAEEYQAAFGRQALDEFLLQAVPDTQYSPGALHELLLKLPWSDVLTTNYDTLFERTDVLSRRYGVVHTPADIPGTRKPRIIKLHGTFPSVRPFVITEEDFRTYLRTNAPFVNLAQQVLMESMLCLIGFSGDDPNFLHWSGWVRDNLGSSSPQIYLCGLLDLTDAQRSLLKRRNVTPVDLSPLFPAKAWPDSDDRQAKAAEWFLLTLEAGEPPSMVHWPEHISPEYTPPSGVLPSVLPANGAQIVQEPRCPKR